MIAEEIVKILESRYPKCIAEEWDNVGFLVGSSKKEIKKIQISLDATEKAIKNAIENDVDMMITHHPMIFTSIKNVTDDTILGKKIMKLIENKITLYTLHTNIDSAGGGLNDFILAKLEITNSKILDENEKLCNSGIGRIYKLEKELSLKNYLKIVKNKLEIDKIRVITNNIEIPIKKIALINGAGMSYWNKVANLGVDLLITGDITYHNGLDAKERGLNLFDIGHFESEKYFEKLIRKNLENLNLELEIITFNDGPIFETY